MTNTDTLLVEEMTSAERDPRSAFARWNLVRTVLAVIAFLGNVAAVAG